MASGIIYEELGVKERTLLLRAFDYDVDSEGYVLDRDGKRIVSEEHTGEFLKVDQVALVPGSLDIIDGSAPSLSKFIREHKQKEK